MSKSYDTLRTFLFLLLFLSAGALAANNISNPIIWADVPDISIIRIGDKYYMASTTMHMNPGVPIMESSDLVNWKTINYVHTALSDLDVSNLANGKNDYGRGSWAASIRYKNGTYYVLVPGRPTGKTHLWTTTDIANGPWKEVTFPFYHDPSLILDDDGRNYIVYGSGDIKIVELTADLTAVKTGGVNQTLIANATAASGSTTGLAAEGSHIEKINGYYYVFLICWPSGSMRTELVFRSSTLTGTYTGKVALKSNGVAQGSVIQTPDGTWYGYLFQDHGAVGRTPWLLPLTWVDNWPVFGTNGVALATISMDAPAPSDGYGIVISDDFTSTKLPLEWQWNHNPIDTAWSLASRSGFMRITTSRTDSDFLQARNTLTQRTYGPTSSGQIAIETAGMKDGDFAGLGALQQQYGLVGVQISGTSKNVVMVNASSGTPTVVQSVPVTATRLYFRIDMNFLNRADKATFYYSTNGTTWSTIGNTLSMSYTIPHFMGYRFALFNYATKASGGYADFDYFKIGKTYDNPIVFYSTNSSSSSVVSSSSSAIPQAAYSFASIPGKIEAENYDVGGEGVAYQDNDIENKGGVYRTTEGVDIYSNESLNSYVVGHTIVGEWLEYTVNVIKSGIYEWEASVSASGSGAGFHILLDDYAITENIAIPSTESFDSYTIVSGTTPVLTEGTHVIRLVVDGSYFNIDWVNFTERSSSLKPELADKIPPHQGIYQVYSVLGIYLGSVNLSGKEGIREQISRLTAQERGIYVIKAKKGGQSYLINLHKDTSEN